MRVIKECPSEPFEQCVLALGNFDGIHLGHQRLLESGRKKAQELGVKLSVLILDPHPLKCLFPERVIGFLTTKDQQLEIFAEMGVDIVYILPFTHEMAKTTPQEFVEKILISLGIVHIIVGFNYTFGEKGKGDPTLLQHYGEEYGFGVSVLQAQTLEGQVISSTSIRKEILQGNISKAKRMLGRSPSLVGTVITGEQRGRTIGYPTANLQVPKDCIIPKRGVYAVWMEYEGKTFQGMMNIGRKPTFHDQYEETVEIHFFDFVENIYGRDLAIHIVERIRDEKKFSGVNELTNQLKQDATEIKMLLDPNLISK